LTDVRRHSIRHWIIAVLIGALAIPALSVIAPTAATAKGKCTQKVKGPHTGTLNVASGEKLCVVDANQTGDINVASGGKLKIIRSKVTGAISLASGFVKFKMCRSRQLGGAAVSVTGGTKSVLMGGTAACPGNKISGALNMTSNQAGLKLGKNEIVGATTLATNLVKTRVSGNTITGALNCSANSPEPTNGGSRNDVEGARAGQTCAAASF
jgi:hypothetical protein